MRRVPDNYRNVDSRMRVKKSLKTKSIDLARLRRSDLVKADDEFWMSLAIEAAEKGGVTHATRVAEERRY